MGCPLPDSPFRFVDVELSAVVHAGLQYERRGELVDAAIADHGLPRCRSLLQS